MELKNKWIPERLQQPQYRFYLVSRNGKIPLQPAWNTDNNYQYNDMKLLSHLNNGGNYGVCTGFGDLVVIDFDSRKYYESVKNIMPDTFTVRTAGKQLPHMYYHLVDSKMIKKIAVKDKRDRTLCDIQAARVGVVGANSKINRRYYQVINDRDIAQLTMYQLKRIFNVYPEQNNNYDRNMFKDKPEDYKTSVDGMNMLGITKRSHIHYQCPYHPMYGKGNMVVLPDGGIYCFHCQRYWRNFMMFQTEYEKVIKK